MTAPTDPNDGDLFEEEPGVVQRFDAASGLWVTVQPKSDAAVQRELFEEGRADDVSHSSVPHGKGGHGQGS